MDLFRRIFGKTSEESSEEQPNVGAQPAPDAKQPAAETAESQESAVTEEPVQSKSSGDTEDLDAATLPVRMPNAPKPKKPIPDGVTQPLSPEVLIANTNSTLSFGQASDVGLVRNNNQDAVLSLFFTSESVDDHPNFGLFIVADGMGGHHDGEKAAAIAIRTVATHMNKQIYMPLLTTNGKADLPPISDMLREAVQKSNKEVIANVPDGGTTVTAVAVVGDLAYIAHVGDSRAYLITADGIEQITRDHSLV
ncbi:MAG: PP2C family protein-serine/threonine phosphatase, partial [Chloroflexota bacterium]